MVKLTTKSQLLTRLSITEGHFSKIKGEEWVNHYFQRIYLPKKWGGRRLVIRVRDEKYRNALRHIHDFLEEAFSFGEHVQWFTKGRSTYTNAAKHLNKKVVINGDVRHFFESIDLETVRALFQETGCNDEISDLLTEIVSLNGKIVAGFCTSPIIANIIFRPIDAKLIGLAEKFGYTYSRYWDDMTFSSNDSAHLISKDDIEGILHVHGFSIHDKKYKVQYRGSGQYVTGLTVCENDRPRIPKRIKRNIRLELYYTKKYGTESTKGVFFQNSPFWKIDWWIWYANSVKESKFLEYLSKESDSIAKSEEERTRLSEDEIRKLSDRFGIKPSKDISDVRIYRL